jgi:hypothetical protein
MDESVLNETAFFDVTMGDEKETVDMTELRCEINAVMREKKEREERERVRESAKAAASATHSVSSMSNNSGEVRYSAVALSSSPPCPLSPLS